MIKFGPSGADVRFYQDGGKNLSDMPKWLRGMKLDLYEYNCGRGVNVSSVRAEELRTAFSSCGIEISLHAPYYINLANTDVELAAKSFIYIKQSAAAIKKMGGSRVVIHTATVGKNSRESSFSLAKERLHILSDEIERNEFTDIKFCLETMGKHGQIGTLSEITEFCGVSKYFYPCIDFGHVNSYTLGKLKTQKDYGEIIKEMLDMLPFEKVRDMHVHFSKIQYGQKGEVRHLNFDDTKYGPDFEPLMAVLHEHKLEPYIVCESDGNQAIDALAMKNHFFSLT